MADVRPARRRIAAALCALGAVAALALIAVAIAPHRQDGPVLATIVVGPLAGQASVGMDEAAGRAYVATTDSGSGSAHGSVRVLDTARAALIGTTAMPVQASGSGVTNVVVDARRGRVYAVNAGSTSCSSTGGGPQTCVITGAAILVLDARTRRTLRTLRVDASRALTIDERSGLLYTLPFAPGTVSGGTTPLRAIDPGTGRTVRTINLPGGGQGFGWGTLAIDGRGTRLVVARTLFGPSRVSPSMDVVDLTRGRLLRHTPLPGAGGGYYTSALIDEARGRAVLRTGAGVAVLDLRSGALLRVTPLGAGLGTIVEDTRTGRVFTTTLGAMRTVTTRTSNGSSSTSVPAGVGSLQTLDARTGALLHTLPIDLATTGVMVDERRGRVYVLSVGAADAHNELTRPGTLSVVDERSGQVVRTLATGAVPFSLTLDRRADRLLLECIGPIGGTAPDDPWGWIPGPVRRLLPFIPRPPAPTPRTPQGSVMILDTTRL